MTQSGRISKISNKNMGDTSWDKKWEKIFQNKEWGKYPSEDLIRFVANNYYRVSERKKIRFLDLGCGPGSNSWYLGREGFSV